MRYNLKRIFLITIFLFIFSTISTAIYQRKGIVELPETKLRTHQFKKEKVNILCLGLDNVSKPERCDTIILTSLDLKNNYINLLSIPRDTLIEIPDYGEDKIAHSYEHNGVITVKKVVENLLDVPVDYYVIVKIDGLKKIIDTIGGVEIDVEKRMKYTDKKQNLYINLYPGKQVLNGDKALQYVRFRADELGDIGRVERQQKFIHATVENLLRIRNLPHLPKIIITGLNSVDTNLSKVQVLSLFYILKKFNKKDIHSFTLLGSSFECIEEIYYLEPDRNFLEEIRPKFLVENIN